MTPSCRDSVLLTEKQNFDMGTSVGPSWKITTPGRVVSFDSVCRRVSLVRNGVLYTRIHTERTDVTSAFGNWYASNRRSVFFSSCAWHWRLAPRVKRPMLVPNA